MSVLIVDYGMGNLASVKRALEECGANAFISDNPTDLTDCSHILLPGVGAFSDAMQRLQQGGWVEPLRRTVCDDNIPLLGICLGMQLLADVGEEGGIHPGLGIIPGRVVRLQPVANERIPHVGWNSVAHQHHELFDGVPVNSDVYFVHSYHFMPADAEDIRATTPYCGNFVSAVGRDAAFGTQFHPEKSSRHGLRILKNFLTWRGEAAGFAAREEQTSRFVRPPVRSYRA